MTSPSNLNLYEYVKRERQERGKVNFTTQEKSNMILDKDHAQQVIDLLIKHLNENMISFFIDGNSIKAIRTDSMMTLKSEYDGVLFSALLDILEEESDLNEMLIKRLSEKKLILSKL
jgi:hypothetical protein